MFKEKACFIGMRRMRDLVKLIEIYESRKGFMATSRRQEFKAWECLIRESGCPPSMLPEEPYLDPALLDKFLAWKQSCEMAKAEHA